VVRPIARLKSSDPPHAQTGSGLLDYILAWTRSLINAPIAGTVALGLATALGTELLPIVYCGAHDTPMPDLDAALYR